LSLARNFLHAAAIEFAHPRKGEMLAFFRPLPPELQDFLVRLGHSSGYNGKSR